MYSNHSPSDDPPTDLDSSTTTNTTKPKRKSKCKSQSMSQSPSTHKKRKHRDFDTTSTVISDTTYTSASSQQHTQQQPPPKKKARISKRSSKRASNTDYNGNGEQTANSHVTITFANINGTIDAVILPKQNVLAMASDVLLANKGKLSIKTSDPIQSDITPQIPIEIKLLNTPNIKTIHPRNSFRMGTSLFYCSDEERLFWSFPLRNTRRVSCQHYCTAVEKIVTRSVGIHSNKCNGKHTAHTPCIYAVCNGKPPKGIIPAKLFANYQYFQHSAKTDLLVQKNPNDEKFKKVENTANNSTMYQNVKIIANHPNVLHATQSTGPPPLDPMHDTDDTLNRSQTPNASPPHSQPQPQPAQFIKTEFTVQSIDSEAVLKRRRVQMNNTEPAPFVQNVQIDLKALSEKQKRSQLGVSPSNMVTACSTDTEPGTHDYSALLLHSTSSVVRDRDSQNEALLDMVELNEEKHVQDEDVRNYEKIKKKYRFNPYKMYIDLLMNGKFDEVVTALDALIPSEDKPGYPGNGSNDKKKKKLANDTQSQQNGKQLNEYRLLMATALYYRDEVKNGENDISNALHYCNLITSQSTEHAICVYEARKIRGLIHKKLRNYKAACHDFEFISYQNPYHSTWRDKLYVMAGKNSYLENKIISPKNSGTTTVLRKRPKLPPSHDHEQQPLPPSMYAIDGYHAAHPRMNEIMTHHPTPHVHYVQSANLRHVQHPHFLSTFNPDLSHQPITDNVFPGLPDPMISDMNMEAMADIHALHANSEAFTTLPQPPTVMIAAPDTATAAPPTYQRQVATDTNHNKLREEEDDISNPNAPIIFVPSALHRNNRTNAVPPPVSVPAETHSDSHGVSAQQPTETRSDQNEKQRESMLGELDIDPALFTANYSDLLAAPKAFPQRSTSNTSFDGLLALAHAASEDNEIQADIKADMNEGGQALQAQIPTILNAEDLLRDLQNIETLKRKTTREELLGEEAMQANLVRTNENEFEGDNKKNAVSDEKKEVADSELQGEKEEDKKTENSKVPEDVDDANLLSLPAMLGLSRTLSKTPEPLDRMRSDCLVSTLSQ